MSRALGLARVGFWVWNALPATALLDQSLTSGRDGQTRQPLRAKDVRRHPTLPVVQRLAKVLSVLVMELLG
jgi:hypothetical protein